MRERLRSIATPAPWILILAAGALWRLWIASSWGLLADEAYHWRWAQHLAWGYYDQPPAVAWVLALSEALLGRSPLALRVLPIAVAMGGMALLARHAGDRSHFALWAVALPPIWLTTQLAVPDTLLMGAWAATVAGALSGGRAWWGAGVAAGFAGLCKPTGWLLLPLLLLAIPATERRTPHPWIALGASVLMVAPNLAWNAANDWVMLRFQVSENLLSAAAPGALGPVRMGLEQLAFATPLAAAAAVAWWVRVPWRSRRQALAWMSSAPLMLGFAGAAVFGPPEAHWPAPAWLGVGLGLSWSGGWLGRLTRSGAWLGVMVSGAIALHAHVPLLRLAPDPAVRLAEGVAVADGVAQWALPVGLAAHDPRLATEGPVVLTERYQEAAFVAYHTGLTTQALAGCGRASQDLFWPSRGRERPTRNRRPAGSDPAPSRQYNGRYFLRPARSGPLRCVQPHYQVHSGPHAITGHDQAGRVVGHWQLFELKSTEPAP
ncbi:MAG: glycosyltransferase family 39 protein [Myxococcales bacterium]|nr:glycosyltransferase family 39 protein [Myxococcales bacterium]